MVLPSLSDVCPFQDLFVHLPTLEWVSWLDTILDGRCTDRPSNAFLPLAGVLL